MPNLLLTGALAFDSALKHKDTTHIYELHKLDSHIGVVLPCEEEAMHTAMRHIHTIDMNGFTITVAVPAKLFDSSAYVPFLRMHSKDTVAEAREMLRYTATNEPVPGNQKYHLCTMFRSQRHTVVPKR